MRKLALSILALVLLASTAIGAPEGWEHINGMERLSGVQNNGVAQDRGGSFYLNLNALQLELRPWQDGSGDTLTLRPRLNANNLTLASELVETNYGWQADMLNGDTGNTWKLRLLDLQSDKVPEALDSFLAPGVALVYSIPVSDIPTSGEWIPKRIAFGGIASECGFYVQADQSADPNVTQPKWVPGSLAIYHNTKRNNIGFRKHGTGKIAHMPRPLMVGRNASGYTGYAFGDYREVSHGVFDKVFNMTEILADPSQTTTKFGIGAPTSVHVSADIGWQTMGSTNTGDGGQAWLSKVLVSTLAGECTDVVVGLSNDMTSGAADYGFYTGTSGDSDTSIWQTDTATADSAVSDNGGYWNHKAPVGATVTNGGSYRVIYDAGTADFRQDFPGGNPGHDRIAHTDNTAFPSPLGTTGSRTSTNSVYMTVETTVVPPVTTNAALSDATPGVGDTVELTATITDGDNVTTAWEWFVGVDPGEGSGTTGTALTGSSPFSVADDIDTTGLSYGAHTVSCRGYNATDGWGAVDTVNMTVRLIAPTNLVGTGADVSIDLTWDEDTDAAGHIIYVGASPNPTGASYDTTNATSFTVPSLTNGNTYFIRITAQIVGSGPAYSYYSNEIEVVAGVASGGDNAGLNLGIGLE